MKTYRVIAAFSKFHKYIVQSKFPACRSIHKKVSLNVKYVDKNTYTYIYIYRIKKGDMNKKSVTKVN
jgi:hypothetical protein